MAIPSIEVLLGVSAVRRGAPNVSTLDAMTEFVDDRRQASLAGALWITVLCCLVAVLGLSLCISLLHLGWPPVGFEASGATWGLSLLVGGAVAVLGAAVSILRARLGGWRRKDIALMVLSLGILLAYPTLYLFEIGV